MSQVCVTVEVVWKTVVNMCCVGEDAESTRHRWPSGQEELPGLQLVLVVKHHGVDPGYRTVLEAEISD